MSFGLMNNRVWTELHDRRAATFLVTHAATVCGDPSWGMLSGEVPGWPKQWTWNWMR